MKLRPFLFSSLLSLLGLAFPTQAQYLGTINPVTQSQAIFSAQSTPATSPIVTSSAQSYTCTPTNGNPCGVPNLGVTVHFLSYTVSGSTPCNVDIRLEAANSGAGAFFPISEDGTDNPSQLSPTQGGGVFAVSSYPIVRVNLVSIANACTISATYSGTSSTAPLGNSIYSAAQGFRRFVFNGTNFPGPAALTNSIRTLTGTTGGRIFLQATGAGLNNTIITVTNQLGFGMVAPVILSKTITGTLTAGTVIMDVPDVPASYLTFSLTPGTNCATTCTVTLLYQFGGAPTEVSAITPALQTARATSSTFIAETSTTNPGANAQLLNISPSSLAGSPTTYLEQLVLSSSVAVQINVVLVSTLGSTCTAVTSSNTHGTNSGITSTAALSLVNNACGTPPTTVRNLYSVFVPANDQRIIDLSSLLFEPSTTGGISIQAAASVTGTVTVSQRFFER